MRCARAAGGARATARRCRPPCASRWSRTSRDEESFDEIFDAFFALVRIGAEDRGHGHGHGHDDLSDDGALEDFTLSEEPSETPQQGHDHGKPVDIREFFDPEDMAQQYNLHQEANKIDLAAMTDEIVLSKDGATDETGDGREGPDRDRPPARRRAARRHRAREPGTKVDADLDVAQQEALLGWLQGVEDGIRDEGDETDAHGAAPAPGRRCSRTSRRRIKRHLER